MYWSFLNFGRSSPVPGFNKPKPKFRRANITSSQARYDYILAKLPHDVVTSILDLLDTITEATPDPYKFLKDCLFATFVPTRLCRTNQLLQMTPLRRPTPQYPHGRYAGPFTARRSSQ